MFRNFFFALVLSIVMIGCDSSHLILDDVLLTDADKGTLYINPDNVPSAYSRHPAGDFTIDIPEEILFKIGSYNSGLFHGDRIYYSYKEYEHPGNKNTVNGGGIVFCDRNGKYISHREIDSPRGNGVFPRRYVPVNVFGIYDNHLIIQIIRYTDLYSVYDSFFSASHIVKLNLDTFEWTWIDGSGDWSLERSVRAEFVIENILYIRRQPGFVTQEHWDNNRKDRLYAYDLDIGEYTPEHDITINHGYQFDWQIAGEPPNEASSFSIDIYDTRNDLSAQLARASFDRVVYDGTGGLWVNVVWDFIPNYLEACDIHPTDNFLAKFDMQGNFTGEIVDITSTCEDHQTYNKNVPMFPLDSDGEFLYFPAWDPNKDLNWVWKPYKYVCYKRN
ncbi:hypothetical protein C6503_10385 [Candidatus Poribacteria bacterium]|nr:MAG: hypothetical protein C6503_10385 [Candidatus Poribacteria bacterium]